MQHSRLRIGAFDGNYGWSEVRQILKATWIALMLHGVALVFGDLSLSRGAALCLIPLLGQWMIVAPLYVGIPVYIVRRNILQFKKEEECRLRAQHALASDLTHKTAIANRLDRLRSLKVLPFVSLGGKALVVISLLSSLITVVELARLIYFPK